MRIKGSCVSDPNSFITCPGDIYHVLYSPKLEDDGTITLKESDRIDIDTRINSFAPLCDMAYIISKLNVGDTSVLRAGGSYGDFTQMPKTYAEMLDLVRRSDAEFARLPVDIKAAFDNDVSQWFATAGSDEWLKKMKVGDFNAEVDNTGTETA